MSMSGRGPTGGTLPEANFTNSPRCSSKPEPSKLVGTSPEFQFRHRRVHEVRFVGIEVIRFQVAVGRRQRVDPLRETGAEAVTFVVCTAIGLLRGDGETLPGAHSKSFPVLSCFDENFGV